MIDFNQKLFQVYSEYVSSIEENWKNNHLTSKDANEKLTELLKTLVLAIARAENLETQAKLTTLNSKLVDLINETLEEMKSIYIVRTNKDKVLAVSDKRLVERCIERLGKVNVKFSKINVCQTEEDLEGVLLEDKLEEQLKNPRIVHLLTDKDCPLY